MVELLIALTAVIGSTAALSIVSSGRGTIPPVVAGWPFVVLIGTLAAFAPGYLGAIFATVYSILAVLLLTVALNRVTAGPLSGSSEKQELWPRLLSAAVLAIPTLGAATLWLGSDDGMGFAALLGVLMPLLAVATRVCHAISSRLVRIMAVLIAAVAVIVTVLDYAGGAASSASRDWVVRIVLLAFSALAGAIALVVSQAGHQATTLARLRLVTAGLWAAIAASLAVAVVFAENIALVTAAVLTIVVSMLSALMWLRFDVSRNIELAQTCDGGTQDATSQEA